MAHTFSPLRRVPLLFLAIGGLLFRGGAAGAETDPHAKFALQLERLQRLAAAGQHAVVVAESDALLAVSPYAEIWEGLGKNAKMALAPEERQARESELTDIFFLRNQSAAALAAGDSERLQRLAEAWKEAAERFSRMLKPKRVAEARYEAAQALAMAGKSRPARDILARLQQERLPPALEGEACRLLAATLFDLARQQESKAAAAASETERRAALQQRDKFYQEALTPLRRISMYCGTSQHHGWAEVALSETLMRLGNYLEAANVADGFLRREIQRSALRSRALARRAACSQHLGDLETAARLFREVLESDATEEDVRRDALCGLGWCYGHLSRLADAEQHSRLLRLGRAALTDALATLPPEDERRQSLAYLLAEISLADKTPAEAERLAAALLAEPEWRFRAAYARGQALRDLGRAGDGIVQMQALMRWPPQTEEDVRIQQQARRALADIEFTNGNSAAALVWFRQAAEEARRWRDETAIAEADLGIAKSLITLAQDMTARPRTMSRLAAAAICLALGCTDAVAAMNLSAQAWRLSRAAGAAEDAEALAILDRLARRYAAHIRQDEMAYWRGLALRNQADAVARSAAADSAGEEKVARFYQNAVAAFAPLVRDNPLSPWALPAGLLMAEAQQRHARFLFARASRWQKQNANNEAQVRIAAGKQVLAAALETLAQCLKLPGSAQQLARALQLRGEIHLDLEEFLAAAQDFSALSRQSDIGQAWQCQAARQWADALERQGKIEEALQVLLPYMRADARTAIQAGRLYEALERWAKAYVAYQVSMAAGREEITLAEGCYRLHILGLARAEQLRPDVATEFRRDALRGLEEIVREHARTPWATDALMAVGKWYLERQPSEILPLADATIKNHGDQPTLKQAAKLLLGMALLKLGKAAEAYVALQEAEAIADGDERSRQLRAAAIHGQGEAMLRQNDRQAAMRHYGRVLADYPEVEEIADLCRAALAKCLAEDGKMEEAWRLLEGGKNRALMQQTREDLRKRQRAVPPSGN